MKVFEEDSSVITVVKVKVWLPVAAHQKNFIVTHLACICVASLCACC